MVESTTSRSISVGPPHSWHGGMNSCRMRPSQDIALLLSPVGSEIDGVDDLAHEVVELDGHGFGGAVDPHAAEELQALGWRPVLLHPVGDALEPHLGTERAVDLAGAE